MCARVWTPRYGDQQDCLIDRFMGVCSRSLFHGISEYQTKKIKRDYPVSRHLEAKVPMSCGWRILMGIHTRDLILHLFNSSVVLVCMCCVTPFFQPGCLPFIVQGDTTITCWTKSKHYWIGPTWGGGHAKNASHLLCPLDAKRLQVVCRRDDRLARETHANICPGTHHQSYHMLMLLAQIAHHASGVGNIFMSHQSNDRAMQDANPAL
jgi:hypothetical protein